MKSLDEIKQLLNNAIEKEILKKFQNFEKLMLYINSIEDLKKYKHIFSSLIEIKQVIKKEI